MEMEAEHLTSIFRGVTVEYIGIAEIMLAHMTELTNLQIKKTTPQNGIIGFLQKTV